MSREVEVMIGSRPYRLAVEEGQEPRVREVASLFNDYLNKMKAVATPSMDRDRLLVLAAIMMADDFHALRETNAEETAATESLHNDLADRLESLLQE